MNGSVGPQNQCRPTIQHGLMAMQRASWHVPVVRADSQTGLPTPRRSGDGGRQDLSETATDADVEGVGRRAWSAARRRREEDGTMF